MLLGPLFSWQLIQELKHNFQIDTTIFKIKSRKLTTKISYFSSISSDHSSSTTLLVSSLIWTAAFASISRSLKRSWLSKHGCSRRELSLLTNHSRTTRAGGLWGWVVLNQYIYQCCDSVGQETSLYRIADNILECHRETEPLKQVYKWNSSE